MISEKLVKHPEYWYLLNPTKNEIIGFCRRHEIASLRGLWWDGDLYLWSAYKAVHYEFARDILGVFVRSVMGMDEVDPHKRINIDPYENSEGTFYGKDVPSHIRQMLKMTETVMLSEPEFGWWERDQDQNLSEEFIDFVKRQSVSSVPPSLLAVHKNPSKREMDEILKSSMVYQGDDAMAVLYDAEKEDFYVFPRDILHIDMKIFLREKHNIHMTNPLKLVFYYRGGRIENIFPSISLYNSVFIKFIPELLENKWLSPFLTERAIEKLTERMKS